MGKRQAISYRLRFDVLKRDGFACRYCGQRPPDVVLHLDHVVPVSRGGTDEMANLCACCPACNQGKGDEPIERGTNAEQLRRAMLDTGEDWEPRADQYGEALQHIAPILVTLRRRLGEPYGEGEIIQDLRTYLADGVPFDALLAEAETCADYRDFKIAASSLHLFPDAAWGVRAPEEAVLS